jgi:NADH dehydrogenase
VPRKLIVGDNGQYQYDRAIFAMGVVTTYFGIIGLDEYSYSIKSAEEVMRFKKHLHEYVAADRHLDKNYVIVGAGPTGVELTAALATYLAHIAEKHAVTRSKVSLDLVEAAPRVLPRMSEKASGLVAKRLKQLGVKVMTNKKVEMQDDDSIMVSGRDILSQTVVWTSGVSNHPFFKEHSDVFRLAANGKVEVDAQLQAAHHIFVIGDNANTEFAGLAQTAVHNARFVARVIRADIHGEEPPRFKSKTPAVVVPVGHNWAIFEYKKLRLSGLAGSLVRRAADFVAYMELFPPGVAWRLWWAEAHSEDACDICDLS